jgi:murein DD-endopeptidase MepM/ murein hydrolase activator NlpD
VSWESLLTVVNVAHAGLWALLIPPLLQARSYEGTAFELAPPLRGGTFYVIGGGANPSVNQHPDYAMDIGRLNRFGFGAAGVFPEDLTRYPAFGSEVVAPCAGEVISAENARPNQPPVAPDAADRQGGNHVVIFCDGHSVHLAHMQPGSVSVEPGDRVEIGQHLGLVGNSGNTVVPHLHVDVAAGRHVFERGAEGVPFRIDGRFLVKGDTFSS